MSTRRSRHLVRSLICGAGLLKAANFLSMPFLALFLAKKSTLSPAEIGMLVGLSPLASVVGAFFGGPLSDILGRKQILLGALALIAMVFGGFYWAAGMEPSRAQIYLFAVFNLLNGFGAWMYQPVSQALIGDLLDPSERQRAYQLRYTMINLGAAIGPMLGAAMGVSSSPIGFAATGVFYFAYFLWNAYLIRGLAIARGSRRSRPSFTQALGVLSADRRLRYFILAGAMFMACYSQLESNLSQHLVRQFSNGALLFSTLLSLNGLTVIVFQTPVYMLSRRISPTRSLMLGTLLFAVGMLLIALAGSSLWGIYGGVFLGSTGEIFVFPVSSYFVDSIAPDHLRGTYFGASVLRQLGLSVGPAAGGVLLEHLGGGALFAAASLLALLSIVIHLQGERVAAHQLNQEVAYV
jgi:MFS family permease